VASWDFTYRFDVAGNAVGAAQNIERSMDGVNDSVRRATNLWGGFFGKMAAFNQVSDFMQRFRGTVNDTLAPGASLNAQMHDLAAITQQSGESLRKIEEQARQNAKTFGGTAAQSVESYKLLLSQLSPEIAKSDVALGNMGKSVSTLSKTMGNDTVAAATVLTTAMNQYGVSLADPIAASKTMSEFMNIMAAAAQEGSAELPQIQGALEQSGMAAKAAGVSFAETNAAIQVLDKAGKKGAEGGVALRNVMSTLARGRFLPKDIQKELRRARVDMGALTDTGKTLEERLTLLKPVMNDTALFSKLFGRENVNAAMALVQNIDEVGRLTEAISGTNSAYEQAGIVMDSYNERKARVQAQFDDMKISIFNATGNFGIWVETVAGAMIPIAQLIPLISGLGDMVKWVRSLNLAGMFEHVARFSNAAGYQVLFTKESLDRAALSAGGFGRKIALAGTALVQFATTGLLSGVKALGAYILSLITGGTTSTMFAGVASGAFTTFKIAAVNACRAVGVAIMNIPILGWIAAAIAAIIALFVYFWKTSAQFRGVMKGIWAAFKAYLLGIWEYAKTVFVTIKELILGLFTLDFSRMGDAVSNFGTKMMEIGKSIGNAYMEGYLSEVNKGVHAGNNTVQESVAANPPGQQQPATYGQYKPFSPGSPQEEAAPEAAAGKEKDATGPNAGAGSPISQNIGAVGGNADKADKIKNISVRIDKLIERFEVHTTNVREAATDIRNQVAEAIVNGVNDASIVLR
jgi:TP901 family phage tail tape measure protein